MHQQIQILIENYLGKHSFTALKRKENFPQKSKTQHFYGLEPFAMQYLQDFRNLFYTIAFARFSLLCLLHAMLYIKKNNNNVVNNKK